MAGDSGHSTEIGFAPELGIEGVGCARRSVGQREAREPDRAGGFEERRPVLRNQSSGGWHVFETALADDPVEAEPDAGTGNRSDRIDGRMNGFEREEVDDTVLKPV